MMKKVITKLGLFGLTFGLAIGAAINYCAATITAGDVASDTDMLILNLGDVRSIWTIILAIILKYWYVFAIVVSIIVGALIFVVRKIGSVFRTASH
jgi:uncharacterized membrane protein (UPF0182 family)